MVVWWPFLSFDWRAYEVLLVIQQIALVAYNFFWLAIVMALLVFYEQGGCYSASEHDLLNEQAAGLVFVAWEQGFE